MAETTRGGRMIAQLQREHPAQRFRAPGTITTGMPLKALMDRTLIALVAESFTAARADFPVRRFVAMAEDGLDQLELMPRAAHIGDALRACLPADPAALTDGLIAALGPSLAGTVGMGLAPFFYLPHVQLIRRHLSADVGAGLRANYAITQRFSAEYSIRPLLLAHQPDVLAALHTWIHDPNPHVRRLVSEGTRPRLPWAERLPPFIADPTCNVGLIEKLKDDPELYVRRSVANHLADILKDHPAVAYDCAERWADECAQLTPDRAHARAWLIRHAVRLSAKKGEGRALALRQRLAVR